MTQPQGGPMLGDNVLKSLRGERQCFDKKRNQTLGIKPGKTTMIWLRLRGLHLNQGGIFEDGVGRIQSRVKRGNSSESRNSTTSKVADPTPSGLSIRRRTA